MNPIMPGVRADLVGIKRTMTGTDLITRLADLLSERRDTLRVAVDGPDAAGKTTLADELAGTLDRPAVRVSIDDFHRPREERYARGPLSPEGYLHDCFDFAALRRAVLAPDGALDAVVVVDGVFLHTAELRDCWDLSVYLDVSPAETLRRALVRDVELFGSEAVIRERYEHRYLPGQRLYRTTVRPAEVADVVVDNDDPTAPVIRKWPR
jgi:uridine kinase